MAPKRKGEGGRKGKGLRKKTRREPTPEPEVQEEEIQETEEEEATEPPPQPDASEAAEASQASDTLQELTQQDPGDADDDDTDASALSGTQEAGKKRGKKADTVSLTPEEEASMIEWFHANPCLYDKGSALYKNTQYRHGLWETKAKDMGKTKAQLIQWYNTHRTVYTKLCNQGTGSGAHTMSARKKYAWDNFSFLRKHIHKHTSKSSSFKSNPGAPADNISPGEQNPELTAPPALPSLQEGEPANTPAQTPTPSQTDTNLHTDQQPSTSTGGPPGRRRTSQTPTSAAVTELSAHIQSSTERASRLEDTLITMMKTFAEQNRPQAPPPPQPETARDKWISWLNEEIKLIPDIHFFDFQGRMFKLLEEFKKLGQQHQHQQQIQQQIQHQQQMQQLQQQQQQQQQQFFNPYQGLFQAPQAPASYQQQAQTIHPPVQRMTQPVQINQQLSQPLNQQIQQPHITSIQSQQPHITSITPINRQQQSSLTQLQPVPLPQQPPQPASTGLPGPSQQAQQSAPATPSSQLGLADINLNPMSNLSGISLSQLDTPGSASIPNFAISELAERDNGNFTQERQEMLLEQFRNWQDGRQLSVPSKGTPRKTPRKGTPKKTDTSMPPPAQKKIAVRPPPELSSSDSDTEHYDPDEKK